MLLCINQVAILSGYPQQRFVSEYMSLILPLQNAHTDCLSGLARQLAICNCVHA